MEFIFQVVIANPNQEFISDQIMSFPSLRILKLDHLLMVESLFIQNTE